MKKGKELTNKPMEGLHVYALLFFIVLFAGLLTWIVPAGQFEKMTVEATGRTVYVANSYHPVDSNPQDLWEVMGCIFNGWVSGGTQIFVIFLMGAWVKILEDSNLIKKTFGSLTNVFRGKEKIVVFVVMLLSTIMGSFGVNPNIPLMPLSVMLSYSLGFDGAIAFIMVYLANTCGFGVGAFNVLSVGIAQEIAELPRFSGMGIRILIHAISFAMLCIFTFKYIDRVQKDPTKSLTYGCDVPIEKDEAELDPESAKFTWRDWGNSIVSIGGFAIILYGVTKLNWSMAKYGPVFLTMSILTGLIAGLGINGTAKSFVKGCEKMAFAALIVGIARSISVVLTAGNVIDTIVFYLSAPIAKVGPVIGAALMFIVNSFINFFIPSASGQASTVMPLMVPIADIAGITRQVAVEAFQFGDGISNVIIPTGTSLFVCLGLCGMKYNDYVKWLMPWFIAWNILAFASVIILQAIQWGL